MSSYKAVTVHGITSYARERAMWERYSWRTRRLMFRKALTLLGGIVAWAGVAIVVAMVAFSVARIWGIMFGSVL